MIFSSLSFIIIFLPLVLLFYYIVPTKFKNLILLIFSLIFYYIGEQNYVFLMLLSSFIAYISGVLLSRIKKKRLRKIVLSLAIIINIGLLGYFKYFNFLLESFSQFYKFTYNKLDIILPLGISFYTFQAISYIIDVYRGAKIQKSYLNFATYLTFFPQLIAGPIVRYEDISKEIEASSRKINLELFTSGIKRFCFGLAKKVLIANVLYELLVLYNGASRHTFIFAWTVGIIIPLQIYFDFSGYSDMAIGLGRMLGFHFIENFNYPFISTSTTEFWQRWHISLGTWFRDYIYIPLGGNRVKIARHIFNILLVWLLTGLWHGAAYNFIIWGLYYGVLLILEKYIYGKFLKKHKALGHIYFALITVIGFEIFNATSLSNFTKSLLELLNIGTSDITNIVSSYYLKSYLIVILLAVVLSTPLLKNIYLHLKKAKKYDNLINIVTSIFCIILLILSISYIVDGSYNPFLYFRF